MYSVSTCGLQVTLIFEDLEEDIGEEFVVLLGVADVGEDLRKGLLVVLGNELCRGRQGFFLGVETVNIFFGVVVIGLVVQDSLDR